MPRVIFRIPYLKCGSSERHRTHLVNYIATRERVEKLENFVDYLANRPRVQKLSSHGLFTSGSENIVLSKVAEEVAHHEGNIWIPIISLTREDAARTGFDNAEAWKNFLSQYAITMAENMKISAENFRWYAAFHNERHHPHVHMIIFSKNPQQGFLTQAGIEKIKAGLVKNIFADEMNLVYARQSERRDFLKSKGKEVLQKLLTDMENADTNSSKIGQLLTELSEKLLATGGRHVYGYLPPTVKSIVDEILDELSQIPEVASAYELWYEMRNEVLKSYTNNIPDSLPLSQQKEFKSMKNLIISEAEGFKHMAQAEPEHSQTADIEDVILQEAPFIKAGADAVSLEKSPSQMPTSQSVLPYPTITASVRRLLNHMSKIFADNLTPQNSPTAFRADSKLLRKIREKKIAMGHKADDHELKT